MELSNIEEYVGAIYRLRAEPQIPLPLNNIQEYFGYSPISIHEMVQKLETAGLVTYTRYRGVLLSEKGEKIAQALVRRHRIWERFLTDILNIPWDDSHDIAGQLEHAATEAVTERLSRFLGNPETCPHGTSIPQIDMQHGTAVEDVCVTRLDKVAEPGRYRVIRFSPEQHRSLHVLHEIDIKPGSIIRLEKGNSGLMAFWVEGKSFDLTIDTTKTVWVTQIYQSGVE